jgi:cob(I)alamin adenosyltransferase
LGGELIFEPLEQPWDMGRGLDDPEQAAAMRQAIAAKMACLATLVGEGQFDLVILDELVYCLSVGLANRADVYRLIAGRPKHVELVLTGRGADDDLIAHADLVTRLDEVKHPYQQGLPARPGIDL